MVRWLWNGGLLCQRELNVVFPQWDDKNHVLCSFFFPALCCFCVQRLYKIPFEQIRWNGNFKRCFSHRAKWCGVRHKSEHLIRTTLGVFTPKGYPASPPPWRKAIHLSPQTSISAPSVFPYESALIKSVKRAQRHTHSPILHIQTF